MIINSKVIRWYDPCEQGIENFEKRYPNFNDKLSVLLELDDIPYSDKMWLCCKVLPEKIARKWSLEWCVGTRKKQQEINISILVKLLKQEGM